MESLQKFWPLLVILAIGIVALVLIGLEPGSGGGSGAKEGDVVTLDSGLKYEELKIGEGREAKNGDNVSLLYTGRLAGTDTVFDSSDRHGNRPYTFVLGTGNAIKGWHEGIPGMRVGGKRKLMIPSKLGYGKGGTPDGAIPPDADLEFDVELVKIGR
jgi:FKBP-type peptidyl-prolyl cis-trans isomerase